MAPSRRMAMSLWIVCVLCCLLSGILLFAAQVFATSAHDDERRAGVIVQFKNSVLAGAPSSNAAVNISSETISDSSLLQALIASRATVIRPVFCAQSPVVKNRRDAWFLPTFEHTYVITCSSSDDVPDCVARLYRLGNVVYAEPNNVTLTPLSCQAPNDSLLAPGQSQPYQWWITGTPTHPDSKIRVEEAWANACPGDSVNIGLFDCAFAEDHVDIAPRCTQRGDDYDPTYGHGTWVMGILGANADNGIGITGIARHHHIDAFSFPQCNNTSAEEYADSIRSAVDIYHCDVLGTSAAISGAMYDEPHITINKAIAYAFYQGVPFVASSGNDPMSCVYAPASFDEVVAVGGQDSTGSFWQSSTPGVPHYNHGRLLDLIAPSVWMITTNAPRGYYLTTSGTSFAQPVVTGVIALMKSIRRGLPAEDYIGNLKATSLDVSSAGYDTLTGWGRINAGRAVGNLNRHGRYRLVHGQVTGGTVDPDSQMCKVLAFGCEDYGIQDGTLVRARRFTVRRDVAWPDSAHFVMSDSVFAWGLSNGTNGIRAVEPQVAVWNALEGRFWNRPMCYVDHASIDSAGATLYTHYYKLLDADYNLLAVIGPADPDTAAFAYSAVGPYMRSFSGTVTSDTTLSGPIWVGGDIIIADGATLNIAAGAHLFVAPTDHGHSGDDTTSCEIIVHGGLRVMGSPGSRVRIESNAVAKAAGDWRGMSVKGDADSVILRYCDLRHADVGVEDGGGSLDVRHCTMDSCGIGVKVRNATAAMRDVSARFCADKGFYAYADSPAVASAVFDSCRAEQNVYGFYFGARSDSCRIMNHSKALNNSLEGVVSHSSMRIGPQVWSEGNGQDGVVLIAAGSAAVVSGVKSINNTFSGCYCDSSSSPEVKDSYFSGNYDNFESKHTSLPVLGNHDTGVGGANTNLDPTRYSVVNYWSGHTIKAEDCYWGPLEEGELPVNIYGWVDMVPWLDSDPGFSWRMPSSGKAAWASTNYPNPFNPQTRIDYSVGATVDRVRIRVYDIAGRLIRTLVDEDKGVGRHTVLWDGRNNSGQPAGSGLYFARIQIGTAFEKMQKMMLVK